VQCSNKSRHEESAVVASERKKFQRSDVSSCHITRVPLMFDNSLRWLTAPNSAVMPVHDTIQMECSLIRKKKAVKENLITVNFLQHFLTKSSFCSHGWLLRCASATTICKHANVNVCRQRHELWRGKVHFPASCADRLLLANLETLVYCAPRLRWMSLEGCGDFWFRALPASLSDIYPTSWLSCSFVLNLRARTETYAERVLTDFNSVSHKTQSAICWTVTMTISNSKWLRMRDNRCQQK
jgi:hypothetical protein